MIIYDHYGKIILGITCGYTLYKGVYLYTTYKEIENRDINEKEGNFKELFKKQPKKAFNQALQFCRRYYKERELCEEELDEKNYYIEELKKQYAKDVKQDGLEIAKKEIAEIAEERKAYGVVIKHQKHLNDCLIEENQDLRERVKNYTYFPTKEIYELALANALERKRGDEKRITDLEAKCEEMKKNSDLTKIFFNNLHSDYQEAKESLTMQNREIKTLKRQLETLEENNRQEKKGLTQKFFNFFCQPEEPEIYIAQKKHERIVNEREFGQNDDRFLN
jgi:hypothetical protein